MIRCALFAVIAFAPAAVTAQEAKLKVEKTVKGEYKKYDKKTKTLTLKIDDKEQSFKFDDKTVLYTWAGKPNKFGVGGITRFSLGRLFELSLVKGEGGKLRVAEVRPKRK